MNKTFPFKGITFVLLIFELVLSEGAGAQNVVYSRTRTLEKPHGEDVFIRFFGNSGDMLVHNYDYSLKANVFTCRKAPTHPASNRIVIPFESNSYGGVKYGNTLYALPTSIEQRCLSGNYIIINSEDETETE